MRRDQCALKARRVLDRHIRADAPIRGHRMDGVAEEGDATGTMAGDRIGAGNEIAVEGEQAHPLDEEAHRHVGRAAAAVEDLEQMRRQALMQGEAAGWADVHPVALQAVAKGAITLVNRRTDPDALETL